MTTETVAVRPLAEVARELQNLQAKRAEVGERVEHHRNILDVNRRMRLGLTITPEQRWQAMLDLPGAEQELARLELAIPPLVRERDAAVAAEREATRQQYEPRLRDAVEKLAKALEVARRANLHLHRTQHEMAAALGVTVNDDLAWHELLGETPTHETKLPQWRRRLTEQGWLE